MQDQTQFQARPPRKWTVIAVAFILFVSITALVAVFARNEKHIGSIRTEAETLVLTAQMEAAVQIQAQQAGFLAGQLMNESNDPGLMGNTPMDPNMVMAESGPSTTEMEGSGENSTSSNSSINGAGASLPDDPTMTAATESFYQAVLGLRQLVADSEQTLLDDVVAAHTAFGASIVEFEAQSESGNAAMSFYHSDTQSIEGSLRSVLLGFKEDTSIRLESAIEDSRTAQFQRGIAVPPIILVGLLAGISLVRTAATRRRLNTLEGLIKAKDEFIATVSHELRTPLTGIVGFAELLHESGGSIAPHERAEMIASITEQGREVTAIVEDLLVAARAEIGQLAIDSSTVDLRIQAAQVLETLRLEVAGVELAKNGSSQVVGDPIRIRQIVRNLVTNAARYGSGAPRIEFGTTDDHGYLQVHSSGPAIPNGDRERIFEPYHRSRNEPQMPGSIGLGLSVARRLARLMDGDVSYTHREEMNIFELTLPLDFSAKAPSPALIEHAAG